MMLRHLTSGERDSMVIPRRRDVGRFSGTHAQNAILSCRQLPPLPSFRSLESLFIEPPTCTDNIPAAVRDRMEISEMPGITFEDEKLGNAQALPRFTRQWHRRVGGGGDAGSPTTSCFDHPRGDHYGEAGVAEISSARSGPLPARRDADREGNTRRPSASQVAESACIMGPKTF